jgi:hypothetical protein
VHGFESHGIEAGSDRDEPSLPAISLGLKSIVSGTLTTCLLGAIVGMMS